MKETEHEVHHTRTIELHICMHICMQHMQYCAIPLSSVSLQQTERKRTWDLSTTTLSDSLDHSHARRVLSKGRNSLAAVTTISHRLDKSDGCGRNFCYNSIHHLSQTPLWKVCTKQTTGSRICESILPDRHASSAVYSLPPAWSLVQPHNMLFGKGTSC